MKARFIANACLLCLLSSAASAQSYLMRTDVNVNLRSGPRLDRVRGQPMNEIRQLTRQRDALAS